MLLNCFYNRQWPIFLNYMLYKYFMNNREMSKIRILKPLTYIFVSVIFYFPLNARMMCQPFIIGVQKAKLSTTSCKWNPGCPPQSGIVVALVKGLQSHFYIVTRLHTWDGKYSLAAKDRRSRRTLWYLLTYLWCSQHEMCRDIY